MIKVSFVTAPDNAGETFLRDEIDVTVRHVRGRDRDDI